jgi:hypothetical protein
MSNQLERAAAAVAYPLTNGTERATAQFILDQQADVVAKNARIVELEAGLAAARRELMDARDFIVDNVGQVGIVSYLNSFLNGTISAPETTSNVVHQIKLATAAAFAGKMRGDIYSPLIDDINRISTTFGVTVLDDEPKEYRA